MLKPIFRRAFLDEHQIRHPSYPRRGEDFVFMVEAFLRGAKYAWVPGAGYLSIGGGSNLSRTTINYRVMYQPTEALMCDARIAADPALVHFLRERAAAVRWLTAETDHFHFRRERDVRTFG